MAPGSKTSFCTKSSMLTKMAGLIVLNVNVPARLWRIVPLEKGVVGEVACAVAQVDPINLGLKTRPTLCA